MWETLLILLPQTLLAGLACLFILGGTFPVAPRYWGPLAIGALLVSAAGLALSAGIQQTIDSDSLFPAVSNSSLSIGFQWSTLVVGVLLVLSSMGAQAESHTAGEFYGLLLLILAGLMLVASANDLVLMFLALELISIPTYVLLYLGRRDYRSQEATTKYFLLSILSAAILLYGFAFLYGLTGSTRLTAIQVVLGQSYASGSSGVPSAGGSVLGILALVLILAGLGFKLAAVPFHFYAPDVYEGTSAFNASLLAIVPKAAGLFALIRVASESMIGFEATGQQLVLIVAAITMTGGNCLALLQTNVRRLLAYSSVAHAGYMLMGIAVGFWESWNSNLSLGSATRQGLMGLPGGIEASLLYLLAYSVTSAGLFAVLIYLARPGRQIDHIDELTGLGKSHPWLAGMTALFLFSLAGIPPLPGFWGKLSVFASALSVRHPDDTSIFAVHPAFAALAIIGVLNAAIGAVYYLKLVAVMFLNEPLSAPRPGGGRPALVASAGAAVLVVIFGILPRPLFDYLERPGRPQQQAAAQVEVSAPAAVTSVDR